METDDATGRIHAMLADGYEVARVESSQTRLFISFERGPTQQTLTFDEDEARELLGRRLTRRAMKAKA